MYNYNKLAILVFFILAYSLLSIGHFGGDGYQDYLTAESIVLDGNLSINDRPQDKDELNYIYVEGVAGRDGKLYASRGALGVPLILSVFYAMGNIVANFFRHIPHDFITMLFCSFANPVVSAINCFLIFIICGYLKFNIKTAVAVAFIYGLSTMAPAYARTGFAEPMMILFMLLAFYLVLRYKDTSNTLFLVSSGLAAAFIPFVKAGGIIFVPVFIFYAIWITCEQFNKFKFYHICAYLAAILIVLLSILAYNYWIYGSVFNFGRSNVFYYGMRITSSMHFLKGLYYYLFSPGKSFFLFNPILILALFPLFAKRDKRKKECILIVLICIVNLLFYVKSFRRGSLFSWGPRYLSPSVAFMIFFIGDYIEKYKSFLARMWLFVLSITGFFIVLPCMFINQSKFYFFVKEQLKLDEYMINFIPDLSPILSAWKMFISRLADIFLNITIPFVYGPDYRLVPEIVVKMDGYNYFDLWFLKVINYAPHYKNIVFAILGLLAASLLTCLIAIIRNFKNK